jgi:hypothetical protein
LSGAKRYDRNIDKAILSELYPTESRLFTNKTSFNAMYKRICQNYRKISRTTLSFHLRRLKDEEKLLDRDDNSGRGTIVNYYLTEAGKQKYRFYYPSTPSNIGLDEERLEKIYQLLFLFISTHVFNALYSEKEFEDFLSKIPISKDQLVVDTIESAENPYEDIDEDMLVLKSTRTSFKPIKSEILISKEEIEYLPLHKEGFSLDETQNDTKERITLQLKERLKNENIEKSYSYDYFIPGISQSDFINSTPTLKYIGFTKEEVERVFDFLEKNHIIKPINDYLGEKRYWIDDSIKLFRDLIIHEYGEKRDSSDSSNKSLRDLLSEYGGIESRAITKMQLIWMNFRRPTYEERKWYEFLKGKEEAAENFRFAYEFRSSLRKAKKRSDLQNNAKQGIKEIDSQISKTLTELEEKYVDIIQKYNFPLKGVLEMVHPEFIKHATYKTRTNK